MYTIGYGNNKKTYPYFFPPEMKNDMFKNKKPKIKIILQKLSKFYWS